MNCLPLSFLSSLFLSVFFILLFLSTPSDSYLHSSCTGQKTSSAFVQNLYLAMNSLSNEPITHGFINLTIGDYPDQATLLLQCRGDINSTATCQTCAASSGSKLQQICSNHSQGVVWTDDCLLHFFNGNITGKIDYDNKGCICNATAYPKPQALGNFLLTFLNNLTSMTIASNPRFSRAGVGIPGTSQKLSGLAQCTGDVETSECKACLQDAVESVNSCCEGKTSGVFLLGSCYMSFSIFNFTFKSSPTLAATMSVAPTPSPASQQSPQGGWAGLSETAKAAILSATENVGIVAVIGTAFWLYSSSKGRGGIVGSISRGASKLASYRPSNLFGRKQDIQNEVDNGASRSLGFWPSNLFGGSSQAAGEPKKEAAAVGNDKLADRIDEENPPIGKGTTEGVDCQKSQDVAGSSSNIGQKRNEEQQLSRAVVLRSDQSSFQAENLSMLPVQNYRQQGNMVVSQSTRDMPWMGNNANWNPAETDAPQGPERETAVRVATLERELRDSVVAHARLEGSLHTSGTTLEWMMNVFSAWLRLAPPPPIPYSQTLMGQTTVASGGTHSAGTHPHGTLGLPSKSVVVHGHHQDQEAHGAPNSHHHDQDQDGAAQGTTIPSKIGITHLKHSNLVEAPDHCPTNSGKHEPVDLDQACAIKRQSGESRDRHGEDKQFGSRS